MKMFVLVAGMLFGSSVMALPITYDFFNDPFTNHGPSPTFTEGGVDVGVTASNSGLTKDITQITNFGLVMGGRFIVENDNIMSFNFDNDVTLTGVELWVHTFNPSHPNPAQITSGSLPPVNMDFTANGVTPFAGLDLVGSQFDFSGSVINGHSVTEFYGIRSITIDTEVTDVPEPGTLALFAIGLAGLGYSRKFASNV